MKKSFLKKGKETNTAYVDLETGEIIAEDKAVQTYLANNKEQFFFGYYSLIAAIQNLKGPALQTYFYLVLHYKPGTLIGINKAVKEEIRRHIGSKSVGTVSNCLRQLCDSKLLLKNKGSLAGYYVNPRYTYKGNSIERLKCLENILNTVDAEA